MKALIFQAPHEAVVTEIDDPQIGPDEVLVKSHAVGICHSDFELYEGRYIIPVSYPIIPGHEWSGEVVETTSASRSTVLTPNTSRLGASGCTSCRKVSLSPKARWSSRSRSPTTPPSSPAAWIRRTSWRSSAAVQ